MILENLRDQLGQAEALATDAVAKVAPWTAPVPTAYLVGRATVEHLRWPNPVGFVAAVVVESLGLATTVTALELREYNQGKRKSDPTAPFALAAILVAVYLAVAVGLTVALDIAPVLAVYSPAIFPLLSLCGVTVLALRGDHRRRLAAIAELKAERKTRRQKSRQAPVMELSKIVSKDGKNDVNIDILQAGRRQAKEARLDALLDFYLNAPNAGPTAASRAVGVSRQTVYTYLDELEAAGRLSRDNGRVKVLSL